MKKKVLLIHPTIQPEGVSLLKEKTDVVLAPDGKEETIIDYLITDSSIKAVVTRTEKITAKILNASSSLEVIGQHGVGVDNIDLLEATKKGVFVVNAPNANFLSVAEHVVMLILALSRDLLQADKAVRGGNWFFREHHIPSEINSKVLFLVGFGRIAKEVAKKSIAAFNMSVYAFDPFVSHKEMNKHGVKKIDDLSSGLRISDFVSLHVPYTESTHGLINEETLKIMNPKAVLINCARGKIVDQHALARALRENLIKGAALDVFQEEPPDNTELLFGLPNVMFTPHFAGDTIEAKRRCSLEIAGNVLKMLNSEQCASIVNPEAKCNKS